MRLKSTFVLLALLSTYPTFSQNIFIDSNQVSLFLNGSSLWSEASNTLSVSAGFSIGGIFDIGYQGNFVTMEDQGFYNNDFEYDVHSMIVNVILTKKKMQVSLDLAISASKINRSALVIGFSLAKKISFENSVEAVFNLSTGFGFNLDEFPGKVQSALALSADLLLNEVFYFGPGIGYSDNEFFYGLDAGFVISFSSK